MRFTLPACPGPVTRRAAGPTQAPGRLPHPQRRQRPGSGGSRRAAGVGTARGGLRPAAARGLGQSPQPSGIGDGDHAGAPSPRLPRAEPFGLDRLRQRLSGVLLTLRDPRVPFPAAPARPAPPRTPHRSSLALRSARQVLCRSSAVRHARLQSCRRLTRTTLFPAPLWKVPSSPYAPGGPPGGHLRRIFSAPRHRGPRLTAPQTTTRHPHSQPPRRRARPLHAPRTLLADAATSPPTLKRNRSSTAHPVHCR